MQTAPPPDLLISAMKVELRLIPRPVFLCFAALGVFAAAADFIVSTHKSPPPVSYVAAAFQFAVSFLATYSACMWMIGKSQSRLGLSRYFQTYLAMAFPMALGLTIFSLSGENPLGALVALALVLVSGFCLTLLPGWPLLEATSAAPVGPRTAFEATKGIRWQLFSVSCVISAVGSLPALAKAKTMVGGGPARRPPGLPHLHHPDADGPHWRWRPWRYMTDQMAEQDPPANLPD